MKRELKDNRRAAIAQIHIAKKDLALDDDTYRAMLVNTTGKDSCGAMTLWELLKVVKHLESKGFKKKPGASQSKKNTYSPTATGKIIDVMRALWIQMHQAGMVRDGSESALAHWAKRASSQRNGGIGIDSLEWLEREPKLASAVLEDLKQWCKRVALVWKREDAALVYRYAIDHPELTATDVLRHLLTTRRIMYWQDFAGFDIPDSPTYCTHREELTRD